MNRQGMATARSQFFSSEFPDASYSFWKGYSDDVVTSAFASLARKCENYSFASLADAVRYVTAVCRTGAGVELC